MGRESSFLLGVEAFRGRRGASQNPMSLLRSPPMTYIAGLDGCKTVRIVY